MSGDPPLVQARGLTAGYRRRAVIRDLDLGVRAGEWWFLLGANAAGKTTFLRVLLGLLRPWAGAVHWSLGGEPLASVGYVPQAPTTRATLPMSVREFVAQGWFGSRGSRAERTARLGEVLSRTGLDPLASSPVATLSAGERQRALLARALIRPARVLLLDEPARNLDAPSEQALLEELESRRKGRGVAILFVAHDAACARRWGTHVARFEHGAATSCPVEDLPATADPRGGATPRSQLGEGS